MKRIFYAILLKEEEQLIIERAINEIRKTSTGHFTRTSNLHITLEFIGEVNDQTFTKALKILDAIPRKKITLTSNCFHFFNTHGSKQVLTLKIDENDALNELLRLLHSQLDQVGIPYIDRQYTPHITLARKFDGDMIKDFTPMKFVAEKICLMETIHEVDGLIYKQRGTN